MGAKPKPPTAETYAALQKAYTGLNRALFANELPGAILTLRRSGTSGRPATGYYSPERFGRDGVGAVGAVVDEIALEPGYFALGPGEALQTLGHEMAHHWQHHHGTPSRAGYHNAEWAAKMIAIGLMPTDTGAPGGKTTGQRMGDYVIEGGRFQTVAVKLCRGGFEVAWYDRAGAGRFRPIGPGGHTGTGDGNNTTTGKPPVKPVSKVKFTCPTCGANAWGKPSLTIACVADHDGQPPALMISQD